MDLYKISMDRGCGRAQPIPCLDVRRAVWFGCEGRFFPISIRTDGGCGLDCDETFTSAFGGCCILFGLLRFELERVFGRLVILGLLAVFSLFAPPLPAHGAQFGQTSMERAIVMSFVAQHESEPSWFASTGSFVLKALRALHEPEVLGEAVDQDDLGCGLRLVFLVESVTEFCEALYGFVADEAELAGQGVPARRRMHGGAG